MPSSWRFTLACGVFLAAAIVRSQTIVSWLDIGSDFATASNWSGGASPTNDTATNVIAFAAPTPSPGAQPTLSAAYSVAGVRFVGGAGAYTVSGTGPLTVGSSGIENQTAAGAQTISVPLVFGGAASSITNADALLVSGSVTNNTTSGLTLGGTGNSGVISGVIGGSGDLIKDGFGTWTLSGTNTYSGSTTIRGGMLTITGDASLGAVPSSATPGSLTFDGGVLHTAASLTLAANRGIALASFGGGIEIDGAATLTYDGSIRGLGGLVKSGTGTLMLGGTNTAQGDTLVYAGTLTDSAANAFSSSSRMKIHADGTLAVTRDETVHGIDDLGGDGGTVTIASGAALSVNGSGVFSGSISGSGALVIANGGGQTFVGTASHTGGTTIAAGGSLYVGSGGTMGSVSGAIVVNGELNFDRSDTIGYGGFTGTGQIRLSGPGTLELSGTNSYTGATILSEGTLSDAAAGAYSPASPIFIEGSGVALNVNFNETIGGLGGFSMSVGSTVNLASTAVLTIKSSRETYAGTIQGLGGVVVTGTGSQTFSGANTYSGGTSINSGMLIVANTSGSGTGTGGITIANGATLQLGSGGSGGMVTGDITNGGSVLFNSSDTVSYGGVISGGGRLNVGFQNSGAGGTLELTGANTYSGGTSIGQSTLRIGAVNTLPTSTSLSFGSSCGMLDVAFDQTVAQFIGGSGHASIQIASGATLTIAPISGMFGSVFEGMIYGDGALKFNGASDTSLDLVGDNTFTGGMTVLGGTLRIGNSTTTEGGVVSGPVGTGLLSLGANTALVVGRSDGYPVDLANDVALATNVTLAGNGGHDYLNLSGDVTVPTSAATVHLKDYVALSGSLKAVSGITAVTFDSAVGEFGSVVLLGTADSSISSITASGAGVIFGSAGAVPASAATTSVNASTGYIGIGAVPGFTPPSAGAVLNLINPATFNGALGFDTIPDDGLPYVFNDALDLSAFGSNFTLGSTSVAVLTGAITAPSTGHAFGNGGGALIVRSPLGGAGGVKVSSTTAVPDNSLTVSLEGDNTFTGDLSVTNSAVVLNSATALPSGGKVTLGANGYIGYTEAFTGVASFADFLATCLTPGGYTASSVVGIDSCDYIHNRVDLDLETGGRYTNETIDLSTLGPVYFGTATHLIVSGMLIAPNQSGANKTLSLTTAEDGALVINSPLYGSNVSSVVLGSPTAADVKGAVVINSAGNYTGGTTLTSGVLVLGSSSKVKAGAVVAGPLGTGTLAVPANAKKPALVAGGWGPDYFVQLDNAIALGTELRIGVKPQDHPDWVEWLTAKYLSLNGVISDLGAAPGSLRIFSSTRLGRANTFSGGVTLEGGVSLSLGSETALGTGALTIRAYNAPVSLWASNNVQTIANAINYYGDPSRVLSLGGSQAGLTFSGPIALNDSLMISSPTPVSFTGLVSGSGRLLWDGTSRLTLNPSGGANTFSGGLHATYGGVVLASADALPSTGMLSADWSGYVGLSFVPADVQATFLNRFNRGGTTGTIGFDSASVASPNTFTTPISLRDFNSDARLGSSTAAILSPSAIITPSDMCYDFGGGGGFLEVQSALVNDSITNPTATLPRSLNVISPASQPLTLRLTGANTFTGGSYIYNSAVIFGSGSLPGSGSIHASQGGYVGTEDTAFGANSDVFVNRLDPASCDAIVGFDSFQSGSPYLVTGPISLADFTSGTDPRIYLGTATQAEISGAIALPAAQSVYRFAGYKGGRLTVSSVLSDGGSARMVEIGDANSPATAGALGFSPSVPNPTGPVSSVTLNAANDYTGGTILNAGALYVGDDLALGTGSITVAGSSYVPYRGLFASGGARSLANPIAVDGRLSVGGADDLTLSGDLTGDAPLAKVGGGTLTLLGSNFSYGGILQVWEGSLVFQNGGSVGSSALELMAGASVTFADDSTLYGFVSSGGATGGTINLTPGKTLTIRQDVDVDIAGVFAGSTDGLALEGRSMAAYTSGPTSGGAHLRLSGASTFTGPTTIGTGVVVIAANASALGASTNAVTLDGGGLVVDSGITFSNPITLAAGRLGGLGTLKAPSGAGGFDIKNDLVLSPGPMNSVGTFTFDGSLLATATLILDGSGTYDWHLLDAANAGGWDKVVVTGTVNIAATAASPFNFKLISITPDGSLGLAAGFDPTQAYSWTVLAADSITGFTSSNQFNIDPGSFFNPNGGMFTLSVTGGTALTLSFSPVPEPSTYVLIIAGLGVTFFASRRRRNRAQQ